MKKLISTCWILCLGAISIASANEEPSSCETQTKIKFKEYVQQNPTDFQYLFRNRVSAQQMRQAEIQVSNTEEVTPGSLAQRFDSRVNMTVHTENGLKESANLQVMLFSADWNCAPGEVALADIYDENHHKFIFLDPNFGLSETRR